MPSRVDICNMALAEIAAAPIASLDEASLEARECRRVYTQTLVEMLERYEWGFAVRRVALAIATNDRPNEWAYAYSLPPDVGTPRRLIPDLTGTGLGLPIALPGEPYREVWSGALLSDYAIEGGLIYSNDAGALLEYGASSVPEAAMPAMFVRALALEIASRIVMPIRKSREMKGDLIKQAEIAKERAVADDMNRQPQRDGWFENEAAQARFGSYLGVSG